MKIKILLSFLILIFFAICKDRNKQLNEVGFWKYYDGFYIGDFLEFKNQLIKNQNDTIYYSQIPVALILKIENRFFTGDKLLHFKDIATDKKGIYISK